MELRETRPVKEIVKGILNNWKPARDKDTELYEMVVWVLHREPLIDLTFLELKKLQELKKIPTFDTVTRARRLLQEKHPELRGDSWKDRQKYSIKVKKNVEEITSKKY